MAREGVLISRRKGHPRLQAKSGRLAVGLLALAVLGAGCMKAQIPDARYAPTGLAPEDAITVILDQPPGEEYSARLEKNVPGTALTERRAQPDQPVREGLAASKPATPTATLRVVRDILATVVIDREPTRAPSPIPAGIGRLYYFTEIVEVGPPMTILHVWYRQNIYVNAILLEVKGPRFRTWSYKTIPATWTGEWRVEARTPDGTVLSSKTFLVEPAKRTGDADQW